MTDRMLKSALFYHDEGLNVIPVVYRDKMPALAQWEEYQSRQSTRDEVLEWFGNGNQYNVGLVHGQLANGLFYGAIDLDHEQGILDQIKEQFPHLLSGRLEQSGSLEGYHIPMLLETRPDFGHDNRQGRPRGNRTWKTDRGHVNARIAGCQTVAPPSLHPSGNVYRFLQKGPITQLPNLDDVIAWLNRLAPPSAKSAPLAPSRPVRPAGGNDLLSAVMDAWPTAQTVFEHFGLVKSIQAEQNGETRILGNGGLLIAADDPCIWYNFSDEFGGHVIEAWGWCRFGSAYDKARNFRQVLVEMAQAAGIDVAQFYRQGDERVTVQRGGDRRYWEQRHGAWGQMREAV